jgi:hypothetical protein
VSALNGHRYTYRPMKQWFVSELQEALGSSVHDVQMILNYLSTRDDLDMSRVGMCWGRIRRYHHDPGRRDRSAYQDDRRD